MRYLVAVLVLCAGMGGQDVCTGSCMTQQWKHEAPTPEPLLVPAVPNDSMICAEFNTAGQFIQKCHEYTCTDKTRILLHSEDGKAWCLATPKGK